MVVQAHIEKDGALRLPVEWCDRFGWHAGDRLVVELREGGVLVRGAAASDAGAEAAALGEAEAMMAGEILPEEDFSGWESGGG